MVSNWLYKAGGLLAVVLGVFFAGYTQGRHSVELSNQQAIVAQQQHVITQEHAQQSITARVDAAHAASAAATRTVYQTIEKEVIRYVSQASTPACLLPAGWVRLHDAAALSAIPAAPSESDGAASAFTTDDALGVITGNYETCESTASN